MRKVALLTMQRSTNYGAVLQAYALQESISRLGVRCEILDLLRPLHAGYRPSPRNTTLVPYRITKNSSRPSLGSTIKGHGRRLLNALISMRRRKRFQQFDQAYFAYSRDTYRGEEDLYTASLDYDAFITGSDQVWNPTYPYSPEPYFLTFAGKGVPRIAYAPSFGVNQLDAAVYDQYREWLNGITRLSIREKRGAAIIRELTGRSAQVVLDPTLLLEELDWVKLAKGPKIQKPYIFCYALGDNPDVMTLCRHLQGLTGYPLYRLGNVDRLFLNGCKAVIDAGPQEFLGWIKNAAVVVTNSFHGAVLSVNMRKPFYVIPGLDRGPNSRNSRLENILDMLALMDRVWTPEIPFRALASLDIAYDVVARHLLPEREKSIRFLSDAVFSDVSAI